MLFLFYSCSTKKNTVTSRAYHNLTAHYNSYFNGKESLKEGEKKISTNYKDNFNQILPVFTYSDASTAQLATAEMDKAIKKASKVITMHSLKVKPNKKRTAKTKKQKAFMKKSDYCNWIDNSYLLMGKANFYKHEFYTAAESFEFVISKFNSEPSKFEAMMWLARNNNELGKYSKSKEILDQIDGERKFPKKYKAEASAIFADYFLKQKKYDDAIPQLLTAIEKVKKKKVKARYKFILAQLYQNVNESSKATKLYSEVIKMNPNYEMVFNAQINRSASFESSYGNSKEIKKQLNKMIRDDKNIDYLDQLYYALANIEKKEGNEPKAIDYYKLSAEKSVSNDYQKAISFLALADIYFSKPKYKEAQAYYDSTMTFLPTSHQDYPKISLLSANLNELITHSNTIQFQDSVQVIAKMSEKERNKLIDGIIEKIKEEERRQQEELQQQQINSMIFNQNQQTAKVNPGSSGGKWYFYNQGMLGVGMSEFKRKWGTRKLEDNWRRKNKSIVMSDPFAENADSSATDTKKKISNTKSRDYYLTEVPITDSMMMASNQKIIDAYFNLGKVYKEKFLDYKLAITTFEEFIKRFPENEYLLDVYYYLFQLNMIEKNQSKAEYYKNLIITKYPESKYANALTNPNYTKELEEALLKISNIYAETYDDFEKANYSKVLESCNYVENQYTDNIYSPKFRFLKAISKGKVNGPSEMIIELKSVISDFPDDGVSEYAKEVLSKMKTLGIKDESGNTLVIESDSTAEQIDSTKAKEPELYILNENETHFYMLVAINKKIDANRLQFNIINFNTDKFPKIEYNTSTVELNDKYNIITVKNFDNKESALNYFKKINEDINVFKNFSTNNYSQFLISASNFATFFSNKDIDKYKNFFDNNYK
ncbi:MAG: hypothetical protein A2046_08375 [Bacteroidetes bacterium GWA2_30_7]|nr:MAG: hypothetical protein A2046_08375 [Bacteroidetes bacterium GWA2_30_7]